MLKVFSAFSFYESQGTRLVADIQGVGNLFTDPQVLSSDYRFGDGDLGPRGMALFFHTFRHNTVASAMGIPVFALSKNELKHQSKYEDDVFSMSEDSSSFFETIKGLNRFEVMDLNRNRRKSVFLMPPKEIVPDDMKETEKRSNQKYGKTREETRKSLDISLKFTPLKRTKSEVDEVQLCLNLAKEDFQFDMKTFFRKESGELMAKLKEPKKMAKKRSSLVIRRVSEPMRICDSTKLNLGRVHYQLAVLHGMGRFPEVVPANDSDDAPSHDVFSVLFHLCHAASLRCVPACLALGRILAGLGTCVSELLDSFVPVDFEAAKDLLKRAMESECPANAPKVAAGCVLYQIYVDEVSVAQEEFKYDDDDEQDQPCTKHTVVSDLVLTNLLEDILDIMAACDEERESNLEFKARSATGSYSFRVGDKVEGNYFLEGNYYSGIVDSVSEDGAVITVKYEDDGTVESLSTDNVRMRIPPTATQTNLGGPLTDEEAGFGGSSDETINMESYQLKADLAELVANAGDKSKASKLYEEAAHEAIQANKMKTATEWSLKAAELL